MLSEKRGRSWILCVCDILFIIKFYGCMVYMSMSEYSVIIVAVADIYWWERDLKMSALIHEFRARVLEAYSRSLLLSRDRDAVVFMRDEHQRVIMRGERLYAF